jgi:histidinol dehydrogenase
MLILNTRDPDFKIEFKKLHQKLLVIPARVQQTVGQIFKSIARRGDKTLFLYTRRFDQHRLSARTIRVSEGELKRAQNLIPPEDLRTLRFAALRIRNFHKHQSRKGFRIKDSTGAVLEQRVMPLRRVGLCIPAGAAPLASTVLMTAIPARLAGVKELVMISPWPGGETSPHILAAAELVGVKEIYKVGGAQGVAALALGTESIPGVDKIVGPGNIWVNAAKLFAFQRGLVDIDTLAGPSEVVIVGDGTVSAPFAAADLLSQAEHGVDSMAILITTSKDYADKLIQELRRQARVLSRTKMLQVAFRRSMRIIICSDLEEAAELVNQIAPEHLEIHTNRPGEFLKNVQNAASVFLGPYSPVPLGDYLAGPNHVLPTAGRASFASPLGVDDFIKTQSITSFTRAAFEHVAPHAERFALLEGLDAHARAVAIRIKKSKNKNK